MKKIFMILVLFIGMGHVLAYSPYEEFNDDVYDNVVQSSSDGINMAMIFGKDSLFTTAIVISLVIALITTIIVVLTLYFKSANIVFEHSAQNYLDKGSVEYTINERHYKGMSTRKREIKKN